MSENQISQDTEEISEATQINIFNAYHIRRFTYDELITLSNKDLCKYYNDVDTAGNEAMGFAMTSINEPEPNEAFQALNLFAEKKQEIDREMANRFCDAVERGVL